MSTIDSKWPQEAGGTAMMIDIDQRHHPSDPKPM